MERNNAKAFPTTGRKSKKVWTTPQVNEYEIPETKSNPSGGGDVDGSYYES